LNPSFRNDATPNDPAALVRKVITACADCDTCRFLMNEDCLFFPALYRTADREAESDRPCSDRELRELIDLCTLCGLCPCPNIRNDIMRAKQAFVARDGLPAGHRLLADVQRLGRLCGRVPKLFNAAAAHHGLRRLTGCLAGIAPDCPVPRLPQANFFAWAAHRALDRMPQGGNGVAYFAGCTAGYLFPQVARSAVTVLQRSGVDVVVPPQQCCGMPTLVEGDGRTTLTRARANLETLLELRRKGYVPVSSCPTCGFLVKVLMKEGAYYSGAYQRSVDAADQEIKVPDEAGGGFMRLHKTVYADILKDDGLFNGLDPLDRIALSDGFADIGEYLADRFETGGENPHVGPVPGRMVYFAPCHQREQKIGSPYLGLLARVPGLTIAPVGGAMDCCGMGGSLGFKASFQDASVAIGRPLMERITAAAPEAVVTDCLSCRLRFVHLLPFPVLQPLELMARASNRPI
jgi:glycerol-3-phosphate dehydrogenase subunit C